MKAVKSDNLKKIRALKIPKNSKGSDIFSILEVNPFPKKEIKVAAKHKEILTFAGGYSKKERKKIGRAILERIRIEFPAEKVAHLTKTTRRQYRNRFGTEMEWVIFCSHVQHCRRAVRKDIKRKKSKVKPKDRRSTYDVYIHSEEWLEVKNRYYRKFGRKCAACGSVNRVHLHHMYYGNFGHEEDADLIPLCEKHHKEYHDKNGTQRNMIKRTMDFVNEIKELNSFN